jgi:hypothetical protein
MKTECAEGLKVDNINDYNLIRDMIGHGEKYNGVDCDRFLYGSTDAYAAVR